MAILQGPTDIVYSSINIATGMEFPVTSRG